MSQVVPAQPWKAITVELEGYLQASKNETGVQVISVVGAPGIGKSSGCKQLPIIFLRFGISSW